MAEFDAFHAGADPRAYERLGAHPGPKGTRFAVWAPDAERVWVIGDFNGWSGDGAELYQTSGLGVWVGQVAAARVGHRYKYRIRSRHGGDTFDKADPYAFWAEIPPATASIVAELPSRFTDGAWMRER